MILAWQQRIKENPAVDFYWQKKSSWASSHLSILTPDLSLQSPHKNSDFGQYRCWVTFRFARAVEALRMLSYPDYFTLVATTPSSSMNGNLLARSSRSDVEHRDLCRICRQYRITESDYDAAIAVKTYHHDQIQTEWLLCLILEKSSARNFC